MDALDFKFYNKYKTEYTIEKNTRVQLEKCPYFETNILELDKNKSISYKNLDSFVIYMIMEGESYLKYDDGIMNIKKGETILLPASVSEVEIQVSEYTKIIEVFLPK